MKRATVIFLSLIMLLSRIVVLAADSPISVTAYPEPGEIAAAGIIQLSSDNFDIYYTVDGSDPKSSDTALLFDKNYGIIVTEDITVKAYAFDGKRQSDVYTFNYKCVSPLLPEDESFSETSLGSWITQDTQVKKSGECSVRIDGNGKDEYMAQNVELDTRFDYTLSFWIKTEELSVVNQLDRDVSDSAYVSVLLTGGAGYDRHINGTRGIFLGLEEKLVTIKANQDWTYYEIPINDMFGIYKSLLITTGLKKDVGKMWIDGMKLTARQKSVYPLSVSADGRIYGDNYYEDTNSDFVIDQSFLLVNNAAVSESGTLSYVITEDSNQDKIIGKGSIKAKVEAGEEKPLKISLPDVDSYGTYTVRFKFTSALTEKTYPAGKLTIARAEDSSEINNDSMFGVAIDPNYSDCSVFGGAGIGTVRFDLDWEKVEPQKGQFSIPPKIEQTIDTCNENNIDALVIFNSHGWPEWYEYGDETKTGFPVTDTQISQFVEYAEYVVEYFKGRVKYYELFNETNGVFNITAPENYVRLMKAVYPAVKAIDPDVKLITGVMSSVASKDGTDDYFCEEMFKNGAADYMDIFSFHPYIRPNSPESVDWAGQIENMHKIMRKYTDKDIPFWFTELGYSTNRTASGVTLEKQRDYLVRTFAWAKSLGYVERISVYREESHSHMPYDFEICFGVFSGRGFKKGTLNPSGAALSAFINRINGKEFDKALHLAEGLYVHKYIGGKEDLYLIWTDDAERYAEITTSNKTAKLIDVYGNVESASYNGKSFVTSVSGKMLYLTLEKDEIIESITLSKAMPEIRKKPNTLTIAITASIVLFAAAVVYLIAKKKNADNITE